MKKRITITRYDDLTETQVQRIKQLRDSGDPVVLISRKTHVSRPVVRKVLGIDKAKHDPRKMRGVYWVQNDLTGEKFVGRSIDVFSTWGSLVCDSKAERVLLQRAIREDGLAAFSWKVLVADASLSASQLDRLCNTFIKHLDTVNNGYNTGYLSDGSCYEVDLANKTPLQILQSIAEQK